MPPDTTDDAAPAAPPVPATPWGRLTTREAEVAKLLARGRTNREIGDELDISQKTVDTHRGHVLKKLAAASGRACRNNSDLTRHAIREGVITAED